MLLREISTQFCSEDNAADHGILFECTGFMASTETALFWENFKDFAEPDEGEKLVKEEKNDEPQNLVARMCSQA